MELTPHGLPAYKTYSQAGTNRIVYCYECQVFHVYYGTICIDMGRQAVETLANSLRAYLACYEGSVPPNERCIEVGTPYRSVRFLFSVMDLSNFSKMLIDAYQAYDLQRQAMNN
ncbi:MAG: hypothetical protein AAGA31_21275 [Bacteroidota bacterium]